MFSAKWLLVNPFPDRNRFKFSFTDKMWGHLVVIGVVGDLRFEQLLFFTPIKMILHSTSKSAVMLLSSGLRMNDEVLLLLTSHTVFIIAHWCQEFWLVWFGLTNWKSWLVNKNCKSAYCCRILLFLQNFLNPSEPVKQWPKRVKPKPGEFFFFLFNRTVLIVRRHIINEPSVPPSGSQTPSLPWKPQLHLGSDPRLANLSRSRYRAFFPSSQLSLHARDPIWLLEDPKLWV